MNAATQINRPPSPVRMTGQAAGIAAEWADKRGHTLADMLGPSKKWPLAQDRQDCWADIRERTELSFEQISRAFNRDHSSIVYGVQAAKRRAAKMERRNRIYRATEGAEI